MCVCVRVYVCVCVHVWVVCVRLTLRCQRVSPDMCCGNSSILYGIWFVPACIPFA